MKKKTFNKPHVEKATWKIWTFSSFVLAVISFAIPWKIKQNQKEIYGSLYDYRDQLPIQMIERTNVGFAADEFLKHLKKDDYNRFIINVYLGPPPPIISLRLAGVDENIKSHIKEGLGKWKEYFNFRYTDKIEDADIKVFTELVILDKLHMGGRAMSAGAWNHEAWKRAYRDKNVLQNSILTNPRFVNSANPDYDEYVVAHEFGHFLGLYHPNDVLYFNIQHIDGSKDLNSVNYNLANKVYREQDALHPDFPNLTIMTAVGSLSPGKTKLGVFDKKAMEIILKHYEENSHESTSDKPKTSATNWRQQIRQQQSTASLGRKIS